MYLLLRNNKQSGPYSLDELKNMGLKAYDLVWLEGKSAAWRYPGEIPELSVFAPPVEEQPFDRFYKRPSTTAATISSDIPATSVTTTASEASIIPTVTTPVTTSTPVQPVEAPVTIETPVKIVAKPIEQPVSAPASVPGKRIIYVTMPAGRSASPVREVVPARETAPAAFTREAVPTREANPIAPMRESAAVGSVREANLFSPMRDSSKVASHASQRVEDYSAQLPSLEEQLEAKSPRQRRERKDRNTRILRPVTIGACILALLTAGIFIGLSLNKNGVKPSQTIAAATPVKNSSPVVNAPTQPAAVTPAGNAQTADATKKPKDSVSTAPNQREAVVPPVVRSPRTSTPREKPAMQKKGMNLPTAKDSAAGMNLNPGNSGAAKGEAVHRADIVSTKNVPANAESSRLDREAARSAVNNQVSVGANGYTVGTFGGINDLQLTVTNRSVYPLDLVVVEVQYIQANKKVYKTENMYFRNVGGGSALMQEAPRSSRGVKVQYKIITISSRELGLSSAGI